MNNRIWRNTFILVKGGQSEVLQLASAWNYLYMPPALGGVESLIEHRKTIEGPTSATPDNLLRISVGIEDKKDLFFRDFEQALTHIWQLL